MSIGNQPIGTPRNGQTSSFDASEYCSLYRKQFNVTYCPAEITTGLVDLSHLPFAGVIAVGVAASLLLVGGSSVSVVKFSSLPRHNDIMGTSSVADN
jgi:hypothetical protein